MNRQRGFSLTLYLVAAALVAGLCFGAFVYGQKVEAEGWIAVVTNLEGELNDLKAESAVREARAARAARDATAQLAKERKERDVERKKWADDVASAWADSVQSAASANPGGDALSTARAERDAARAGLESVLSAAEKARAACDAARSQLVALLGFVNEATH